MGHPALPQRVEPAPGAATVDFPWDRASDVLTRLEDLVTTLRSQLELRPAMIDSIRDWEGTFRDEFDEAYQRIRSVVAGLDEAAVYRALSVVNAAEDANSEQRRLNDAAGSLAEAASEQAAERATERLAEP